MQSPKQEFLQQATGRTRFGEILNQELDEVVHHDCSYPLGSVFVCGRFGAGKSTFADFWQGSQFFPSVYHIDSDHLMRRLYETGMSRSQSDVVQCGELMNVMVSTLSEVKMPFTYSFAGKQTVTPAYYRISKYTPGYSDLSREEKIIPKPVGHMILCDQDVSLRRVRQRQAAGGHPYQELKGEFEEKYLYKQAEIVYGLPSYVDGTDSYYVWDSSTDGKLKMVAEIVASDEGGRRVVIHDQDRAEHFGITQENVSTLFGLYDDYGFLYQKVFGRVVSHEFEGDDRALFEESCDRISQDMMEVILDDIERPLLASAAESAGEKIVFEGGEPFEINVFERPQNFDCLNALATKIAERRQNYGGVLVQSPPEAT